DLHHAEVGVAWLTGSSRVGVLRRGRSALPRPVGLNPLRQQRPARPEASGPLALGVVLEDLPRLRDLHAVLGGDAGGRRAHAERERAAQTQEPAAGHQPTPARSILPRQRRSTAARSARCSGARSCGSSRMRATASRRAASSAAASRSRAATRTSGRPDWRVPKKSPGPRSARSASAILKPSLVAVIAVRRWRGPSPGGAAGGGARTLAL